MSSRWIRFAAAAVVLVAVAIGGILLAGRFDPGEPDPIFFAFQTAANALALILAIALVAAIATYLAVEYLQTRRLDSVAQQFTTRTLVLIPIAIALNIILGQTVVAVLKVPIYLDSIGTILVGVLAGPLAGALTGLLANLLWAYIIPPPFQYPPAAAFAIVAAVIGLLAGSYSHLGFLRPRTNRPLGQLAVGGLVAAALVLGLAWLGFIGYRAFLTAVGGGDPSLAPAPNNPVFDSPVFIALGWLALALVAATILAMAAILVIRRDLTATFVIVCGMVTGIVAALISAPIAAGVFGGVTGAGTDFLVAAFRQAGVDLRLATLGQGLISDPIDKVTTFFVVYAIVTAMARRTKARYPQGEQLVEEAAA
jgi:energy-coupling factor transport system substrate-specific component